MIEFLTEYVAVKKPPIEMNFVFTSSQLPREWFWQADNMSKVIETQILANLQSANIW